MRIRENVGVIPALSKGCNKRIIEGEMVRRIKAMLFTCSPGRSPVKIPVITPKMQNVIIKMNGSIIETPHSD